MIRITGGEWRGRNLKTPPGQATRPTPSRVRQAIFNVLRGELYDCSFFDLFAGSGAVGIEALSRGAAHATFVENSRRALTPLRENLERLECLDRCDLEGRPVAAWIAMGGLAQVEQAVIFLDPPYSQDIADTTLDALGNFAECSNLTQSTCLAQTEKGAEMKEDYGPWALRKSYRHGDTTLWLYDL